MTILGIETSCDETAAAICQNRKILSNTVSQQIVHVEFGGVVPEIASREHEILLNTIVHHTLGESNIHLRELDAISVTQGPGLAGTLIEPRACRSCRRGSSPSGNASNQSSMIL